MNYKEVIVNRLLDKYEKSKHLLYPGESNRRIMLRVDKGDLPEYDYETAEIRDRFNNAARELEQKKLLIIEWVSSLPVI